MKDLLSRILSLLLIALLSFPAGAEAAFRTKYASDAGTDPFWNSVVLLAGNDNNITGQTSFVDQSRYIRTLTPNGNASTTSATAPTGLTSSMAFDGTGDYLSLDSSSDFAFGTGDFTVEFWLRLNATGIQQNLYDSVPASTNGDYPTIYVASNNTLRFYTGTTDKITGGTLTTGQWYHIALARNGTNTRLFIDGTQTGSTYTDSTNYLIGSGGRPFLGGSSYTVGTSPTNGWMAGVRVTKGVARYTSNFTPPVLPLKLGTYEPIVATGGTVTTVGNYRVHTFTSSGTFKVLKGTGHIWYLVVGGGGGGGSDVGGGGGAGGYRENGTYSYPVTVGSYAVTVGTGGAGGAAGGKSKGTSGNNSVFDTVTALGGGGGGVYTNIAGLTGGSGGGAGGGGSGVGGSGTAGQGYAGGNGDGTLYSGAGGGAGGVGTNAQSGGGQTRGGPGRSSSITGISVCRAGGGWGADDPGGSGQCGGAGRNGGAGDNGTANTGGGGGGGDGAEPGGGSGGSGIVIVRYPIGNSTAKVPTSSGLVGWWTFNSTDVTDKIYDRSGRANNGYFINRATSTALTSGLIGQALDFTGSSNDAVITPNTLTFSTATGITVSAWVLTRSVAAGEAMIIDRSPSIASVLNLYRNGSNLLFRIRGADDLGISTVTAGGTLAVNAWTHVVGVRDVASDQILIYVNGSLVSTATDDTTAQISLNVKFGDHGTTSLPWNGKIDDVRIYNRAFSAAEVAQLYRSTQSVSKANVSPTNLTSGLVGYWSFNGPDMAGVTAYDRSGQGNNGTLTNGPVRLGGKIGQALQFNGSTQYVSVAHNASLVNSVISVGLWFKPSVTYNSASTITALVDKTPTGANDYVVNLRGSGGAGEGEFVAGVNGVLTRVITTTTTWNANRWYHIMGTYDGVNMKIYVNGVLQGTTPAAGTITTGANSLRIGTVADATGRFFNGLIDEVRIYNRALSPAEVKRLYNMGK